MSFLLRLLRHLWLDADDARRALGADALARMEAQVAASEAGHSGEICVYVEAGLPPRYLWRQWRSGASIDAVVRERALAQFGQLRVWDTELNNGVLIYLQLAEHRIEIVADRGLARHVPADAWAALLGDMSADFRAGRYEAGLARAIDTVGAALARHFPAQAGAAVPGNELPDRPLLG